jgi:hypothetical protein
LVGSRPVIDTVSGPGVSWWLYGLCNSDSKLYRSVLLNTALARYCKRADRLRLEGEIGA